MTKDEALQIEPGARIVFTKGRRAGRTYYFLRRNAAGRYVLEPTKNTHNQNLTTVREAELRAATIYGTRTHDRPTRGEPPPPSWTPPQTPMPEQEQQPFTDEEFEALFSEKIEQEPDYRYFGERPYILVPITSRDDPWSEEMMVQVSKEGLERLRAAGYKDVYESTIAALLLKVPPSKLSEFKEAYYSMSLPEVSQYFGIGVSGYNVTLLIHYYGLAQKKGGGRRAWPASQKKRQDEAAMSALHPSEEEADEPRVGINRQVEREANRILAAAGPGSRTSPHHSRVSIRMEGTPGTGKTEIAPTRPATPESRLPIAVDPPSDRREAAPMPSDTHPALAALQSSPPSPLNKKEWAAWIAAMEAVARYIEPEETNK
jgi:hypothetical protein